MTPPDEREQPWLLSRRAFLALGVAATAAMGFESAGAAATHPPGPKAARRAPHLTPTQRNSIVKVSIHPGVGIMRVGNSLDAFYLGPEVPGALPPPGTPFRDGSGAVARQAARFRVYGYDVHGKVVGEITSADAATNWHVHLANRKAAWYRFETALDIPEANSTSRRNATVTGAARTNLVLDAGSHSTTEGPSVALLATAMGVTLLLGEMLADVEGRLVVLPGLGQVKAWDGTHVTTFANNDRWLDDMADGPVTATVHMDSRTLVAESAWVATGPPNYAPGIATGWRTWNDVLEDPWVTGGLLTRGNTVSFRRHILPMFVRLARLQWVNAGILRDHGWKSPEDLSDPILIAQLADPGAGNKAFRTAWWKRFRNIKLDVLQRNKLPPLLGDVDAAPFTSPRERIGPTSLQWWRLGQWAAGNFT